MFEFQFVFEFYKAYQFNFIYVPIKWGIQHWLSIKHVFNRGGLSESGN